MSLPSVKVQAYPPGADAPVSVPLFRKTVELSNLLRGYASNADYDDINQVPDDFLVILPVDRLYLPNQFLGSLDMVNRVSAGYPGKVPQPMKKVIDYQGRESVVPASVYSDEQKKQFWETAKKLYQEKPALKKLFKDKLFMKGIFDTILTSNHLDIDFTLGLLAEHLVAVFIDQELTPGEIFQILFYSDATGEKMANTAISYIDAKAYYEKKIPVRLKNNALVVTLKRAIDEAEARIKQIKESEPRFDPNASRGPKTTDEAKDLEIMKEKERVLVEFRAFMDKINKLAGRK
ncbi:MAG: hypothetical protein ACYCQJ_13470 [Nitrososphaerales archaeon]